MRPPRRAGVVLGVGMGGFLDGIVLHMILHVHSMLSARVPTHTVEGLVINMRADGAFHAAMWIVTAAGVLMLWRARGADGAAWPLRILIGAALFGWGLFNLVEGVIDHLVLELHHVVEREGLSGWDYGFLGFALALMAGGWLLMREGKGERRDAGER